MNWELATQIIDPQYMWHLMHSEDKDEILIMEKSGKAFCCIYWFHDSENYVCLSSLSVSEDIRRQGVGTKLQEMREQMAIRMGASSSWLWVKKDSWMHEWYKRRGYVDITDHKTEKGCIWMNKLLKEEQK